MSNPLWNTIAQQTLSEAQLAQLDRYLDLLIDKNKVLNLTRITDRNEAEIKHVADALTALRFIPATPKEGRIKLADVGTGGGIPGVILAIARPDMSVMLIDATRKKLDAVKEMCDQIGVTNVRTLHARMEEVEEKFHVVTVRGVAEMEKLLGWCRKLLRHNGVLLALKGPKLDEELERLSSRAKRQWKIDVNDVNVPELPGHRIASARPAS